MKLLLKAIVILAALALLVILGRNNQDLVSLSLPPLISATPKFPAAYMYYGFFGAGFLVGAIIMTGEKKGGGGSSSSKAK
jgi:uncharacterized membrane protein YciS (DUF1049 family)